MRLHTDTPSKRPGGDSPRIPFAPDHANTGRFFVLHEDSLTQDFLIAQARDIESQWFEQHASGR
jgi:hypothetical protein